jgi:thymidylate synthase (FAD)
VEVVLLDDHPDLSRYALRKIWTAARGCYSTDTPATLWKQSADLSEAKMLKVVKDQVIDSGHLSCLRHVTLTFSVSGISRACSHQLVRSTAGWAFEQQSQRYTRVDLPVTEYVMPRTIAKDPERVKAFDQTLATINGAYSRLIALGVPQEDARALLPNATPTNLTVTANLQALINYCHERLCVLAQEEQRMLASGLRVATIQALPWFRSSLVIKCQLAGVCYETRNKDNKVCGIRPYASRAEKQTPETKEQ